MPRSALYRWGGLVAAIAVAVLAWWIWAGSARSAPQPPRAPTDARVPVIVAPVESATDSLRVDAVGTGLALRSATVQPAVPGEVERVLFAPGDRVRAGQPLLQLDARKERLAVQLAEADVDAARRLVDRLARTEGTGAVPGSVIDEGRVALRRAEIALAQSREALADMTLRAPFDGIVGLAGVDPGDRVTPQTEVTTIDDRRRLLVAFDLPEPYLGRVRPGHPVEAVSVAYPDRTHGGRITQIDNRVSAESRTLRVRAELPNPDDTLRPGMSFRVALTLPGESLLRLPDLALQWGRDGGHAWVIRDGQALRTPLRLVRRLEGAVLVENDVGGGRDLAASAAQADAAPPNGAKPNAKLPNDAPPNAAPLRAGEPVVVEGVQRLRPGRAVTIVEPAA